MRIFGRDFNFNVKFNRRAQIALVAACFGLGLVIFFPIESLETRLNTSLSKATGMDVRISNPRLGLGLRTGLISGGLFGLKAESLELTPPRSSQSFQCARPVVSLKLLALLILRAQIAVRCDVGKSGAPVTLVVRSPLYNMNATSAEAQLSDVALADVGRMASIKGFSGTMSGTVLAESFVAGGSAMTVSWDVEMKNVQTPALVSDFIQLPSLNFESVESEGLHSASKLKVDRLVLGSPNKGPFYADFKIDFGMSQGMPVSGSLSGKQRSDPAFEKSELSSINLDLLFGKVKPSGMREFRKEVQGSPMSLLMPSPE